MTDEEYVAQAMLLGWERDFDYGLRQAWHRPRRPDDVSSKYAIKLMNSYTMWSLCAEYAVKHDTLEGNHEGA
jgi:hypothetical protein